MKRVSLVFQKALKTAGITAQIAPATILAITIMIIKLQFGIFPPSKIIHAAVARPPMRTCPSAPIFQNPLVSILPRLFVPVVAFSVMKGLSALAKRIRRKRSHEGLAAAEPVSEDIPAERAYDGADGATADGSPDEESAGADRAGADAAKKDELPRLLQALTDGVACLAGVLTNTGLVLGMMWALYGGKSVNDTLISPEFMTAMLSINFVIEVVLFPLITPPVIYAVRKSAKK